jgi:hypothetical protein
MIIEELIWYSFFGVEEDTTGRKLKDIDHKVERVLEKLKAQDSKIDQLITREIKSAFKAIQDACISNNEETKKLRLKFAEEQLLKNTMLDVSQSTEGQSNNYWMAVCHYGLTLLCVVRGDHEISERHAASVFQHAPREAREKLLPEVWEIVFQPKCHEIYQWYEEKKQDLLNQDFSSDVSLAKAIAVAKFAGLSGVAVGIALLLGGQGGGFGATQTLKKAKKGLDSDMRHANPQQYRDEAIKNLEQILENKLDERCVICAKEINGDL